MKKILKAAVPALLLLSLVFVGCNNNPGNDDNEKDTDKKTENTDSDDKESDEDNDSDEDEEKSDYLTREISYTIFDDSGYESMNALSFSKVMGNGINLGNTMEASNNWSDSYNLKDASKYETAWAQPVTTKEMFVAMKAAGFDSVRIPVAWTNTMDWSRGDFEINENYLERVGDVVDMALDAGLFVMINDHWDYQWWGLFSHNEDLAWKIYNAIWTQVGNYFKDYDYRLIFEGGNEELGDRFNDTVDTSVDARLNGSVAKYSTKGKLTTAECYAMNKKVNQKFVDIIRGQGSKNAKRFLLIPGYNTDFDKTCSTSYVMPADSTNSVNKLFVSVHYYSPSTFALVSDPDNSWGYSDSWGTASDVSTQNGYFYEMKKFTEEGYGVMIGEYGCALENNTKRKTGDVEWITNILDNCDTYNYVPFMWDCNGYFKKNGGTLGFTDSDVADIYDGRNYAAEEAGTSDGGKISYGIKEIYSASSAALTLDGTKYAGEFTLAKAASVSAGKTVVLKFERPAITADYAGHVLRLYDDSGSLLQTNGWCSGASYPVASENSISIEYTADSDCKISKFTLEVCNPYGEDSENYTSTSMTITGVSLTVE